MKQTQKGFGIMVTLLIIAALGIGGVAVVNMANNSKIELTTQEQEQKVEEAREETKMILASAKVALESNVEYGLDTAISSLASLKVALGNYSSQVKGEFRSEIEDLKAEIEKLEKDLKKKSKNRGSASTSTTVETEEDSIIAEMFTDLIVEIDNDESMMDEMDESESMIDDSDEEVMLEEEDMEDANEEDGSGIEVDLNTESEISL